MASQPVCPFVYFFTSLLLTLLAVSFKNKDLTMYFFQNSICIPSYPQTKSTRTMIRSWWSALQAPSPPQGSFTLSYLAAAVTWCTRSVIPTPHALLLRELSFFKAQLRHDFLCVMNFFMLPGFWTVFSYSPHDSELCLFIFLTPKVRPWTTWVQELYFHLFS